MNIKKLYGIILFGIILSISACRKDDYYESNDVKLRFSVDTLRFDTVFTSLGSATRSLKVYNPKDQPIKVDVTLKNQNNRFFRINADGIKGPVVKNIEIGSRDSIYIFVETTIDPNQPLSISPFVIEDHLDISVNGNTQKLYLEAWGQNANYVPLYQRKW
ncbi:MAG: hypothetical protein IPJ13_12280 [Saprospiraceae bacterium]|nr:hypothetical protein [Saprospiraceae bacterium]